MKRKYVLIGLAIGIVAMFFVLKTIPIGEVMTLFKNAKTTTIIGYVLSSVAILLTVTWRWQIILESQKIKIPFITLWGYRIVGYGISFLTPAAKLGGEPFRAGLLCRHNIKFSKGLSSVVIDKAIDLVFSALFFFIGIIVILFSLALPGLTEIAMLFFAIIFMIGAIFFYKRMVSGQGFIMGAYKFLKLNRIKSFQLPEKKLVEFEALLIKFFRDDKKHFIMTVVASFISWIFMFFEFKFLGLILGYDLSFIGLFLIISLIGLAFLIPIPMALGSMEASQVTVFSIIGENTAGGVALSFVVRARDLIWSAIGIILLSYYGVNVSSDIKKAYNPNGKHSKKKKLKSKKKK
ncbi:flippase-like domain-containing protein [archaeon]|nr:flippase-like domain-containing protein [archaeon]MBL7057386.1 flippase-like domain-containing protein [Candidatus Woesearchaeota archaeon]